MKLYVVGQYGYTTHIPLYDSKENLMPVLDKNGRELFNNGEPLYREREIVFIPGQEKIAGKHYCYIDTSNYNGKALRKAELEELKKELKEDKIKILDERSFKRYCDPAKFDYEQKHASVVEEKDKEIDRLKGLIVEMQSKK